MRVRAEVCEVTPAGVQGSSQCDCSFAACSGRVAVAGRAPAGVHHDATAYRRAGPVRSREAGDPLHRPDAAAVPAAAAAVRAGYPRVLLTPPREPVRVLGVDVFFFKDTATTEIYTLSLHDALPI